MAMLKILIAGEGNGTTKREITEIIFKSVGLAAPDPDSDWPMRSFIVTSTRRLESVSQ
jgi:hypothetical protein